jgi:hypothetical protein
MVVVEENVVYVCVWGGVCADRQQRVASIIMEMGETQTGERKSNLVLRVVAVLLGGQSRYTTMGRGAVRP